MAERTGIEWADATWNPWMGCKKVSAGCKNCYMFRDMSFYGRDPNTVMRASDSTFRKPLTWARNGKVKDGARIFTCSWSDWFIDKADAWRDEAWRIIQQTPFFNYLILTKRSERIAEHLPADWGEGYPNVWLGVSVESQDHEGRVDDLLDVRAAVRWISAEPLLGPLSFWKWFPDGSSPMPEHEKGILWDKNTKYENGLHWIVAGGESDKKSPRLPKLEWLRGIRDQCVKANVPFFYKQFGGTRKLDGAWGGRELDGYTWNEFPVVQHDHHSFTPRA